MPILYNCRDDDGQFRMTKFDENMNVVSSYLCTTDQCECPAGVNPTCRHRRMLLLFLDKGAVDSMWFYDYDRDGWVSVAQEDLDLVPGRIRDPIQTHETPFNEDDRAPQTYSGYETHKGPSQ